MTPTQKERARIRRIVRKELRFYQTMEPRAFRGGADERDRAIYVLEGILELTSAPRQGGK